MKMADRAMAFYYKHYECAGNSSQMVLKMVNSQSDLVYISVTSSLDFLLFNRTDYESSLKISNISRSAHAHK